MDPKELDAVKEWLKDLSPKPWIAEEVTEQGRFVFNNGYFVVRTLSRPDWHVHIVLPIEDQNDARFIAWARNHMPTLLHSLKQKDARIRELEQRLERESRLRREAERRG